jgi:hypothetical protein
VNRWRQMLRCSEGTSKREIMRCLKRYIACEIWRAIRIFKEGPNVA